MAIGPNERRAKDAETDRAFKAQTEKDAKIRRAKTAGLKATRLAKEAADREAAAEKPKPTIRRARSRKAET